MKKQVTVLVSIFFAFSLLLGAAAVYAAPATQTAPVSTPMPKANNRYGTPESRRAFLQEIKPLLDEIAANRQQLASLNNALVTARQAAQAHIKVLKANIKNVTAAQLAKLSDLLLQIKRVHTDFNASGGGIGQLVKNLHAGRLGKDYDAIKLAYANIIRVQKLRIGSLRKLIDLYNQIAVV